MFGYATDETDVLMPAPIVYSHRLVEQQAKARRSSLSFLRPDAKSQLTFRYDESGKPIGIDAVVLSTQHSPEVAQATLREAVMEEIIKPILPQNWVTPDTQFHINPTGQFIIGGPVGDCGLTGHKGRYLWRHGASRWRGFSEIRLRWIDLPPMQGVMWRKTSSPRVSRALRNSGELRHRPCRTDFYQC